MIARGTLSEATIAEMLQHVPTTTERGKWRAAISAVAHACAENGLGDGVAARLLEQWDAPWAGVSYAREIQNLHGNYFCTAGWLISVALSNGFTFPKKERPAGKQATQEKTVRFQLLELLPKFAANGNGCFWAAGGERVDFWLWTASINDMPDVKNEDLSRAWFSVRGNPTSHFTKDGVKRWTVFASSAIERI